VLCDVPADANEDLALNAKVNLQLYRFGP